MGQPTGRSPKPAPCANDHSAMSHGMPKTTMAMTMAVTAPADPAFDASQRRGTKKKNSARTGNAAKMLDHITVHGSAKPKIGVPTSGSSVCKKVGSAIGEVGPILYACYLTKT